MKITKSEIVVVLVAIALLLKPHQAPAQISYQERVDGWAVYHELIAPQHREGQ